MLPVNNGTAVIGGEKAEKSKIPRVDRDQDDVPLWTF
jgi:hypothetical protein